MGGHTGLGFPCALSFLRSEPESPDISESLSESDSLSGPLQAEPAIAAKVPPEDAKGTPEAAVLFVEDLEPDAHGCRFLTKSGLWVLQCLLLISLPLQPRLQKHLTLVSSDFRLRFFFSSMLF